MRIPSQEAFNQLATKKQLGIVHFKGTFLACRQEQDEWVRLYHLGSYFVEGWYASAMDHLHGCRTFTDYTDLDQYEGIIDLPEW